MMISSPPWCDENDIPPPWYSFPKAIESSLGSGHEKTSNKPKLRDEIPDLLIQHSQGHEKQWKTEQLAQTTGDGIAEGSLVP